MSTLAARMAQQIQQHGQSVTVTRPLDSSTRVVNCVAVDFTAGRRYSAAGMRLEGLLNTAQAAPQKFLFTGSADVKENDRLVYNGYRWRIVRAVISNAGLLLRCIGVREGSA